jgi:hypothetical protein
MRAPTVDERQLATYLLQQSATEAIQRPMLLRVVNAPLVALAELAALRELGAGLRRDRMWKHPD